MTNTRDWIGWHDQYADPESSLTRRLRVVQARLAGALSGAPPGPVGLVSLCAGQGHDVIGVLPDHPRRNDVTAVLVEADPVNAGLARSRAAAAGLERIEVREADAGQVANYADVLPADILLLCGIFGNVSDADIHYTAMAAASMCRPGGTVIWTRHRREPDLTPQIRNWFAEAGFDDVAFDAISSARLVGVGVGRLRERVSGGSGATAPDPLTALLARPLFTFGS